VHLLDSNGHQKEDDPSKSTRACALRSGGAREAEGDDLEASSRGGAPQKPNRGLGWGNSEVARQRGGGAVGRVRVMLFRAGGRVQGFKAKPRVPRSSRLGGSGAHTCDTS